MIVYGIGERDAIEAALSKMFELSFTELFKSLLSLSLLILSLLLLVEVVASRSLWYESINSRRTVAAFWWNSCVLRKKAKIGKNDRFG